MKQELIEQSVKQLMEYIDKTGAFVGDQAPLYVQEYLNYEMFTTGGVVCFWLGNALWCGWGLWRVWHWSDERRKQWNHDDHDKDTTGLRLFLSFCIFASTVITLSFGVILTKLILAPRVAVLEHLRSLL